MVPLIKSGKIKVLGIAATERSKLLPDVATIADEVNEAGFRERLSDLCERLDVDGFALDRPKALRAESDDLVTWGPQHHVPVIDDRAG